MAAFACQSGVQGLFRRLDSRASSTSPMAFLILLLFFVLQDIGGALVAGQKVGTVLAFEEHLQRLAPGHQSDQIVFMGERIHRVDEIVAHALLPKRDFQAIREEGKKLVGDSTANGAGSPAGCG